jgi:hypothetical protein
MVQVNRWQALVVFAPVFITTPAAQRRPSRTLPGLLTLACELYRTNAGWARIGVSTEFNHDPTQNPFLNMRAKVACTRRHSKPIFTDIGKNGNVKISAKIGELL